MIPLIGIFFAGILFHTKYSNFIIKRAKEISYTYQRQIIAVVYVIDYLLTFLII